MKEALNSSETSILTRITLRNIPADAILHSHRREDLKSDMEWNCFPPGDTDQHSASCWEKSAVRAGGIAINSVAAPTGLTDAGPVFDSKVLAMKNPVF
jgi:hypothetical protein